METSADRPPDMHSVLLSSPQSLVLTKYIIMVMGSSQISLLTLEGKLCARLWICGIALVLWAYFLKGQGSAGHGWCLWGSDNPFLSPAPIYEGFLICLLLYLLPACTQVLVLGVSGWDRSGSFTHSGEHQEWGSLRACKWFPTVQDVTEVSTWGAQWELSWQ